MNHKVDNDTPRFDVQLLFDEIGVAVDNHQYRDTISLLDMYHVYIRQHQVWCSFCLCHTKLTIISTANIGLTKANSKQTPRKLAYALLDMPYWKVSRRRIGNGPGYILQKGVMTEIDTSSFSSRKSWAFYLLQCVLSFQSSVFCTLVNAGLG